MRAMLCMILLACAGCRTVNNYQITVVIGGRAQAEQTTEAAQGKEVPIDAEVKGLPGL